MANLPTVVTAAGLQPQSPAAINAQLIAAVASVRPDFTANLPGSLIEDISSTDTAAIVQTDSARVETVNSLTPYGANEFLLKELGVMLGVPLGLASNTSVYVQFSGPAGFVIGKGFVVSDGNYQYSLQNGGIVAADGVTPLLFALATQTGIWSVPAGTVTQLVSTIPDGYVVTVVNPQPGLPGADAETQESYRARVLMANLAASQGMFRYLKTLVANISGVQPRLVAVREQETGGWSVIVGGGDNYLVANAIATALFDISTLVGSVMLISTISSASPALVTTFLNHGYAPGQALTIADSNPTNYNGTGYAVIATPTEKTFTLGRSYAVNNIATASWASSGGGTITWTTATAHGVTVGSTFVISGAAPSGYNGSFVAIAGTTGSTLKATHADPGSNTTLGQLNAGIARFDSTGLPAYVDSAVLTPNLRNVEVTITDYPDTYIIPFVNPPLQTVTMVVTWNTTSPNFVSETAIAQLAAPALAAYVNSVFVGQPMILFVMERIFQDAVASILPATLLTRLVFAVAINGVGTPVDVGTGIFAGDPESYFYAVSAGITVEQG